MAKSQAPRRDRAATKSGISQEHNCSRHAVQATTQAITPIRASYLSPGKSLPRMLPINHTHASSEQPIELKANDSNESTPAPFSSL